MNSVWVARLVSTSNRLYWFLLLNVAVLLCLMAGPSHALDCSKHPHAFVCSEVPGEAGWKRHGSARIKHGWLMLAPAGSNQRGTAYFDRKFLASDGLTLNFEFSTSHGGFIWPADGLSVFLFDADQPFKLGKYGGGLGYNYLEHGYLGIGFDSRGNFSNPKDPNGVGDGPGVRENSIVLRGPLSAQNRYIAGRKAEKPLGTLDRKEFIRKAKIKIVPLRTKPGAPVDGYSVDVTVTEPNGSLVGTLKTRLDYRPPDYFKVGFAGSNGAIGAQHRIRGVLVDKPIDLGVEGQQEISQDGEITYHLTADHRSSIREVSTDKEAEFKVTVPDFLEVTSPLTCAKGYEQYCSKVSDTHIKLNFEERGRKIPMIIKGRVKPVAKAGGALVATVDNSVGLVDPSPEDNRVEIFTRLLKGKVTTHNRADIQAGLAEGFDNGKRAPDARVLLFKAKGKEPDEQKRPAQFIRTDSAGEYVFPALPGQAYWLAVDSASIAAGHRVFDDDDYEKKKGDSVIRPEQIWSAAGGLCANGKDGTHQLGSAGYCFGGKRAGATDAFHKDKLWPSLNKMQHLTYIKADKKKKPDLLLGDLNMGFSYEVVTHTRDYGQGSLRQFIASANDGKAKAMLFVPAVGQNNRQGKRKRGWQVKVNKPLPLLLAPGTVLDGKAWKMLSPGQRALPVSALKSGYSAGKDQQSLPGFLSPDFEILGFNAGRSIIHLSADRQEVHDIAIVARSMVQADMGVNVKDGAKGVTIKNNVIGVNAGGSLDKGKKTVYIGIETGSASEVAIEHNLIMGARQAGINFKGSGRIAENLLLDNASGSNSDDAISLQNTSPLKAGRDIIVTKNHINGANGMAIEGWHLVLPQRLHITDNTLMGAGRQHNSLDGEGAGIRLQARSEVGDRVKVTGNLIKNNNGPGVVIANMDNVLSRTAKGNRIFNNHFIDNELNGVAMPIDLTEDSSANPSGDGPTDNTGKYEDDRPNQGIDKPVIRYAFVSGDQLRIAGTVMKSVNSPLTLEFYQHKGNEYRPLFQRQINSPQDSGSMGARYLNSQGKTMEQHWFYFEVPLIEAGVREGEGLVALLIDGQQNTSELGSSVPITRSGNIKATLWYDRNNNGQRESDDPPQAGVRVKLYLVDKQAIQMFSLMEEVSDSKGEVNFSGLPPGTYILKVPEGQPVLAPYRLRDNDEKIVIVDVDKTSDAEFVFIDRSADLDFTPDHRRVVPPGVRVSFRHQLVSSKDGRLTLKPEWQAPTKHSVVNWPIALKLVNCDDPEDNGSSISGVIDMSQRMPVCIKASAFVPAEAPYGLQALMNITAQLNDGGQDLLIARVQNRVTVSEQDSDQLVMQKWVENISQKEARGVVNKAGSGDVLRYTVEFSNAGSAAVSQLDIIGYTPPFSALHKAVSCPDTVPGTLGKCQLLLFGDNRPGYSGKIIWRFSGQLQPGDKGVIQYDVVVE